MDPLTTTTFDTTSNKKFGEIYCNYMGVLTFNCVLCPTQMEHSDEFILHYMIHFKDVFEIKQELQDERSTFELTNAGIVEPVRLICTREIKVEQPSTSICDDVKSESKCDDTDNSSSDVESTQSSKVKLVTPGNCGICGQTFVVRQLLKNHIREHQAGPTPQYYECDVCGRRVNQKKNLLTHIRRRHGQKVKCEICGKMLRQHYMV